jgi:hypothetical protein
VLRRGWVKGYKNKKKKKKMKKKRKKNKYEKYKRLYKKGKDALSIIFSFLDIETLSKYRKCSREIKNIIEKETPCIFIDIKYENFPDFELFNYKKVHIYNDSQLYNFLGNLKNYTLLTNVSICYKINDHICYKLKKLKTINGLNDFSCHFSRIKDFSWLDYLIQTSNINIIRIKDLCIKNDEKSFDIFTSIIKKKKWEVLDLQGVNLPSYIFLQEIYIKTLRITETSKICGKKNIGKIIATIPSIQKVFIRNMKIDHLLIQDLIDQFLLVKKDSILHLLNIKLIDLEKIPNILMFIQQLRQFKTICGNRLKVKFANEFSIRQKINVNQYLF